MSERFYSWWPSGKVVESAVAAAAFFPFAVGIIVGVMITLLTVGIAANTVFSAERERGACSARCDERGYKSATLDAKSICWCAEPKTQSRALAH